jgi:hypothetical protein
MRQYRNFRFRVHQIAGSDLYAWTIYRHDGTCQTCQGRFSQKEKAIRNAQAAIDFFLDRKV